MANSDRANHLEQIAELSGLLHEANADRAQRLTDSQTLTEALEERERAASADRSKHLEQVNELSGLLDEANADRAQRLNDIQTLTGALEERERVASADRSKHLEQVNELSGLLHEANADRAQGLNDIQTLTGALRRLQLERERDSDGAQFRIAPRIVLEARRAPAPAPDTSRTATSGDRRHPDSSWKRERRCEGVGPRTSERLRQNGAAQVRASTTPSNYATFSAFEEQGVVRFYLDQSGPSAVDAKARRWRRPDRSESVTLRAHGVSLLFCPMSDPIHAEPGIPVVSTVYDLQHLEYPMFFTATERASRDGFFAQFGIPPTASCVFLNLHARKSCASCTSSQIV